MTAHLARCRPRLARIAAVPASIAIFCQLLAGPAAALDWKVDNVNVRFDTTLSQGITVRASEREADIIGIANGGTAYSVNHDDGTLNYDDGKVAQNVSRFTSDLDIDGGALSAFFRVTGFVDWQMRNGSTARTPISQQAYDVVGEDLELLDAYGTGNFNIGEAPAQIRIGQQVLSWGESTFIPNGINVINPVDVAQLRTPGATLRDALKPIPMISGSVSATERLSFEAFYELGWKKVETDPPGTFFSTNDFVGAGGSRAFLGFGEVSDLGTSFPAAFTTAVNPFLTGAGQAPVPSFDPTFLGVPRGADDKPSDGGQFGLAMHFFSDALQGAEFGLYYVRYNSRLPIVSAHTGTAAGVTNGLTSAAVIAGVNPAFAPQAASIGVDRYAQTASYFIEYPEDINLFGASFNSQLGNSGWALQGEYSLKKGEPLQIDDSELLFAALTPLSTPPGSPYSAFLDNQLGTYGTNSVIHGYIQRDVSQIQATATKSFGPTLGANSGLFVIEVGLTHVHGMPSQSTLRLNAEGTDTSGNSQQAAIDGAHPGKSAEPTSAFPTPTSWGYRLATQLTYDNVIDAVNLSPRIQWAQDVQGISPQPAGPFREGRKAISFGLRATYLEEWEADVAYTNFFGAGKYNLLSDRDFVSATLKYSF
jgi:Protein of unknown function (DUF1302)